MKTDDKNSRKLHSFRLYLNITLYYHFLLVFQDLLWIINPKKKNFLNYINCAAIKSTRQIYCKKKSECLFSFIKKNYLTLIQFTAEFGELLSF